jgi:hypothetical protein
VRSLATRSPSSTLGSSRVGHDRGGPESAAGRRARVPLLRSRAPARLRRGFQAVGASRTHAHASIFDLGKPDDRSGSGAPR